MPLRNDISRGRLIGYIAVATLLLCLPIGMGLLLSHSRGGYVPQNPTRGDGVDTRLQDPSHPRYDYIRDVEDQERLRHSIAAVKLGAALDEVRKLLGPPSEERREFRKYKFGGGEFLGNSLTYYFKRLDKLSINVGYDEYVELYFDPKNRLKAVFSNVDGIPTVPTNWPN